MKFQTQLWNRSSRTLAATLSGLLLSFAAVPSVQANEITPPKMDGAPLILGAGAVYRDKVYKGYDDDEKVQAIPLVLWENDTFFVRATSVGWKLVANEHWEVAAIGEFHGEGYDSSDSDFLEGMRDRDQSFNAGAQLTYKFGNGFGLRGTWVADVSNEHEGYQTRGEGFYQHGTGNWVFRYAASVVYTSDDYNDFYYGVQADEAVPNVRPAYFADDEVSYRGAAIALWNPGGSKWQVVGGAIFDAYGDEIDDSPIVDDSTMFTGFLALGYRF